MQCESVGGAGVYVAQGGNQLAELARALSMPEKNPGMAEYVGCLNDMMWHRTTEKSDFREARQVLLTEVGVAIGQLTRNRNFGYQREFSAKIIEEIQKLQQNGFTDKAIQVLVAPYQPWAEELLYFVDMGINFAKQNPQLMEWAANPKYQKGLALQLAFDDLHKKLLKQEYAEKELLRFDEAWWDYLSLRLPQTFPTQEEFQTEVGRRVQEQVVELGSFVDDLVANPKLLEEFERAFTPFNILIKQILPEVKDGKVIAQKLPPLLQSMFERGPKAILEEHKPPTPVQEPPKESISLAPRISDQDIDKMVSLIIPITETLVDYTPFAGRFEDFILEHFDIVFRGDGVTNLKDVKEIYIPDIHDSFGHRMLFTIMVNLFATVNSRVFVEIEEAKKRCNAAETFHTCCMETTATVIGWDRTWKQLTTDKRYHKQRSVEEYDLLRTPFQLLDPRRSVVEKIAILTKFLKRRFDELNQVNDLQEAVGMAENISQKIIPETFADRTQCMIESVGELAPEADRSFIIAGESHLIQNQDHYKDEERLSLAKFNTFLKPRNAIVLRPRKEKLDEAESPYKQLFARVTRATIRIMLKDSDFHELFDRNWQEKAK